MDVEDGVLGRGGNQSSSIDGVFERSAADGDCAKRAERILSGIKRHLTYAHLGQQAISRVIEADQSSREGGGGPIEADRQSRRAG